MEQSNISLRYGIHRSPHIAEDGEMMECINVYPRDGEMVNIPLPKEKGNITGALLYVHRNTGYTNYIIYNNGKIEWKAEGAETTTALTEVYTKEPRQVVSVGNTLEVLTENGINYYLFEGGVYSFLGDKLPHIGINFSLSGTLEMKEFDRVDEYVNVNIDTTTKKLGVKTAIMEINAKAMEEGYFTQPFFVRYALRLSDGSHSQHSAPVLMIPSTQNPMVLASGKRLLDQDGKGVDVYAFMAKAKMSYLLEEGSKAKLSSWGDIVSGIDVFVSTPIYTYDQEKDFEGGVWLNNGATLREEELCQALGWTQMEIPSYTTNYGLTTAPAKRSMYGLFREQEGNSFFNYTHIYAYRGIERDSAEVRTDIEQCSNFYLLQSFSLDTVVENERTQMDDYAFNLMDIAVRTRLKDDYLSHDDITASQALAYNSRLILSGVQVTKSVHFKPEEMLQLAEAEVHYSYDSDGKLNTSRTSSNKNPLALNIDVMIEVGGKKVWMRKVGTLPMSYLNAYPYIFYPDSNAKRVRVWCDSGSRAITVNDFTLKPHELLNGAYLFKGFGEIHLSSVSEMPTITATSVTTADADIYLSEVANPFIFPAAYRLRIGSGEVRKLALSYRAMSDAKFGQYPLVAFATDGIWTISINNDGTLGAPTPVSGMVCDNIDSVTPVEDVIFFADSRGLFSISGSQLSMHSRKIEGYVGSFPDVDLSDWNTLKSQDQREIREILRCSKLVYDNKHRLLHIYPSAVENVTYRHYVYSLDNEEYVTMTDSIGIPDRVVALTPYDIIQKGGKLYTYDSELQSSKRKGLMLSRDLTLGNPLVRKIVTALRLYQSAVGEGRVFKMALFASDDRIHWITLSSVRGHSYRYYRLAILTEMTDMDAVSGVTIKHEERYSNRV